MNGFKETTSAWKDFINTGDAGLNKVRAEIRESWERCRRAGVNPYGGKSELILGEPELKNIIKKNQDIINIARPLMKGIYKFVEKSGFIVILTDNRGYVMEIFGDDDTTQRALGLNFMKGASWVEEQVGTNAIGTALILKKPIQVTGVEHYCQQHHGWTCSAAPIFGQSGQLLGIIDVSGPNHDTHLHTLGMVVATAEAIMEQLSIQQKNRELTVVNNRITNILNTMSDGVLYIDQRGIVNQINPAAEHILGITAKELINGSFKELCVNKGFNIVDEMLAQGKSFNYVELLIDTGHKTICCITCGKPIRDHLGNISGGIVLLSPIKSIKNMVNKFSGATANFCFEDIIGKSESILEAARIANLAARSMSTVLLEGESGTGKEVFAQAIHNGSLLQAGPFIAVNCAAIPRELLASELFGYVEGAFTGAKRGGRMGKFELANGGTLFLDEIGDMPLDQQVALLRVLQEKKITRVGGDTVIPVSFRIICATNKNLFNEVEKGNFREDLYYRLNVIMVNIPPLRDRRGDVTMLFKFFLTKTASELGISIHHIDPRVFDYLEQYHWPGNVRQLQNVVERMVNITTDGKITVNHLPAEIYHRTGPEPSSIYQAVRISNQREARKKQNAEKERQEILGFLANYGGNISQVAKEMGISRNTVYRKLRRYGIEY